MNGPLLLAVACLAGYATGRLRPARRLASWAKDQVADRPVRSLRFWLGVPLLLLAVAAQWILHPRRSAENVRSWRGDLPPVSVPRLDPDWTARRGARTTPQGEDL